MAETGFLRSKWMVRSMATLSFGLALVGCGGDGDDDDTSTGPTPTATPVFEFDGKIEFSALENGDAVTLSYDALTAPINWDVEGLLIAAEGQCASPTNCGRVELYVDGQLNNTSHLNPITANFNGLSNPIGEHTIELKLIFDDGSQTGATAQVKVNTEFPTPAVGITSPNPTTSTFVLPESGTFPVTFTAQSVTLAAPGTCGSKLNCGHVFLQLDGDAGNAPGEDYNNIGYDSESPIDANLSYLDTPTGSHDLTISLRHDDGSPYLAPNGAAIQATITINVTSATDPTVAITNLDPTDTNGDGQTEPPVLVLEDDGYRTAFVHFKVTNFELSTNCNGKENCGEVAVKINADNPANNDIGNEPGKDYNYVGVGKSLGGGEYSIDARFHWLELNNGTCLGSQAITLILVDNDHNPIMPSGVEITALAAANIQQNESTVSVGITAPNVYQQNVPANSSLEVPVAFAFTIPDDSDIVLSTPEECLPNVKTCLHMRLFIDDTNGNQSSSLPYNNLDAPAPGEQGGLSINALFSFLDANGYDVYGQMHHVTIGMYNKDGSPYSIGNNDGTKTPVVAGIFFQLAEPNQNTLY